MTATPLISITNVYKRYGRKPILRGVDLSVEAGQVVALLGPNGAGKTTLMRMISGLAKPDRGEIVLGGVTQSRQLHELRRYIGLVSHLPLLYDQLSAMENLLFFAQLYDLPQPQARIENVLQAVDLWRRRNDAVRTYSRGMIQRLAIGRAILHDPPVLLLDEPDTGLDPASAEMLHGLLRQSGNEQRAVLLTTHNLDRAIEWSNQVCLLRNGVIDERYQSSELTSAQLRRMYSEASEAA